jgi:glycosyltransferase involved in cell wall biosynthesis
MKKIIYILPDLSNYHIARLNALARISNTQILVIETKGKSSFMEFRYSSAVDKNINIKIIKKLNILKILLCAKGNTVLIGGWYEFTSIFLLIFKKLLDINLIILSETLNDDKSRVRTLEYIKSKLISSADGFLVGALRHKDYLISLGINAEIIRLGYDVIDNSHFNSYKNLNRGEFNHYLLCVGRLIDLKSFDKAIKILSLVHKYDDTVKLVIAGDGPEKERLKSLSQQLNLMDSVKFLGFVDYKSLPALYHQSIAFLHLSLIEPWGLVVNEAMASESVAIVGKNIGSSELIDDGISGYKVDSENLDKIAQIIIRLINFPEEGLLLRCNANKKIKTYGPSEFAKSILELVQE